MKSQIAISSTVLLLLALSIYFFILSNKERNAKEASEKKVKQLKKNLKEEKVENEKLREKKCQECKKIYSYMPEESLSLSESFEKCFSLIDGISNGEGMVYYLEKDEYIFVDFSLRSEEKEECYLINLISGLIYLPIDEWKKSKGDELISYRSLCSQRGQNHFKLDQIDKLI